jgi:hypothetical protein
VSTGWRAAGLAPFSCAHYSERMLSHKNEAKFSEQFCGKSTLQFPKPTNKLKGYFGMKKKT